MSLRRGLSLTVRWSVPGPQLMCGQQQKRLFSSMNDEEANVVDKSKSTSLTYENGLPRIRLQLPSRQESCLFTLKPLSHSVADLCTFIREEDRGVDRVAFYSQDGTRIAMSDSIESLLRSDFNIQINDRTICVSVPPLGRETHETLERLGDLRSLIAQLYVELNVETFQLQKQTELKEQLHTALQELEPLEKQRASLAEKASKRTRTVTWATLGAMGIQFGVLARLTWWEYSWDIMEPVTYFVGSGTALACFAYYVITKQEYLYPAVYDRVYLRTFYKNASSKKFDVERYNELRNTIAVLESDLSRLRDPLLLKLPLQQVDAVLPNLPHPEDIRKDV